MSQESLEANEADVVEQQFVVADEDETPPEEPPLVEPPIEADPADAVDQHIPVPVDDDDYP